jgi:uncharacterized membrane protein
MDINTTLAQFGISDQLAKDTVLLIVIFIFGFIYGMLLSHHKLMSALANIYVAFAVINALPREMPVTANTKIIIFLAIIVLLTILSRRFFDIAFAGFGANKIWKIYTVSVLEIILILSIVFSIMSKTEATKYVSNTANHYLAGDWFRLVWMVAPLIFMLIFYRGRRH